VSDKTPNEDNLKKLEEMKQTIFNHPGVKQARERYLDEVTSHLNEVLKLHFDENENKDKFNKIIKEMRAFIEKKHL
jgi:hypothetical protein